jgi:3-oxoadipate enol-lactonase
VALKRLTLDAVDIALEERGKAGPAILFVHGFPFDHELWRHQLAAFPSFRRVAPDLRGAGGSRGPDSPEAYSIARYADDLVRVLDALGIAHAVVCGLSMGGYIVFDLLRRHPGRVQAAILCNTKAEADSEEAKRGRDEMAALARAGGAEAVAEKLLAKVLARSTFDQRADVVHEVRRMMECQPVAGIVGALHALRDRPDSTSLLAAIRVPVLVVAGEEDQITPRGGMEEMARAIPGAHFELIGAAGHVTALEQPLAVNAAIASFVKGL